MKFQFKLKGNKKIFLYVGVFICMAVFILHFLFSVLGNRLKQLDSQVRLAEADLQQVLGIQKEKDVVSARCAKYQSYLEVDYWDERRATEELLKTVEEIARKAGVVVINLSPDQAIEESREYKKYKANLRIESTLEQMLSFLHKIEQESLLIKVEQVSASPKDEEAYTIRSEIALGIAVPVS
ncbi:MAG: hypothetical protein HQ547_05235 [Candidatus Omnitrophica bacterium]|nr:hypothetical protein [Candidatus Omnitrophota bacterium]